MKAAEILCRYADGDRNFCGADLRGQSFKGQDISGADFSGADIRGADFSRANLQHTNFSQSRAGLPPSARLLWISALWVLAALAGLLLGIALDIALAAFIPRHLLEKPDYVRGIWLTGRLTLMLWLTLGFIAMRLGSVASGIAGALATVVAVILCLFGNAGVQWAWAAALAVPTAITGNLYMELIGPAITATLRAIAKNKAVWLGTGITAVSAISTIGFIVSRYSPIGATGLLRVFLAVATYLVPFSLAALSASMGYRIIAWKDQRRWLRGIAISLAATGGTRFSHANLTDADFTHAVLQNSDFRQANLTRSCWFQSRGLEFARVNRTYLEDAPIRRLVSSGEGQGATFNYKDLRGVNLQGANLSEAEFIGANLSEANFQNANLAYAKLAQAQLYRANLSGTNLTGACIQDWGISADTQFENVQCEYVYMHLTSQTDQDPYRKPDNRNETFKTGDFQTFIAPLITTINLYSQQDFDPRSVAKTTRTIDILFHEGIDPSATAIALQQLTEQHPEAGIEVVALEGRGNEKVRMQVLVSGEADRSALSAQYSENYHQLKSLPYADLKALLSSMAEKDRHIHRLETLLAQASQQPRFYVETYHHAGEVIMSQSKGNITFKDVQGDISGIAAAGETQTFTGSILGDISGIVANTINQLPVSPDPSHPGARELLSQLQGLIESEEALSEDDKALALEQVNVLAEAAQKPEEGALKRAAKTSMLVLKGLVAGLPDVTEFASAVRDLLTTLGGLLCWV